jgi:eukaryotic-like serine/threonine-protein kinase
MSLTPGTKLGPYEIIAAVGAGGMGEVYRAHDTRLDRDVAVKVLPSTFASDADRMRRFEQEARSVAALNHSNIVGVFDIGTHDGSPYVVYELLQGETLRERMQGGRIPQRRVLDFAQEIANALAAAHEKGIVHRDLKPENVFVTAQNHIKVLDFGLAKLQQGPQSSSSMTMSVAGTVGSATSPGTVLGSAGYMSPEQVRGELVDHRTDIFSFGVVLYEMVAGQRAFRRETGAETMTAILKDEPPEFIDSSQPVSPGLERIMRHCLEKNPADRFQSARDLAFALQTLSGTSVSTTSVAALKRGTSRRWIGYLGTVAITALITALAFMMTKPAEKTAATHFSLDLKKAARHVAISADGKAIVFAAPDEGSGQTLLFLYHIGEEKPTALAGTEGASYPFWSADAKQIGFFSGDSLKKVELRSGNVNTICAAPLARGGTWNANGVILFAPSTGQTLSRVSSEGGRPEVVLTQNAATEASLRFPHFLPDGKHFLFLIPDFSKPREGLGAMHVGSTDSNTHQKLFDSDSNGYYVDPGYIVYGRSGKLYVIAFNLGKLEVHGTPIPIAEDVQFAPSINWSEFAVSRQGTLVAQSSFSPLLSQLSWIDRTGKEVGKVGEAQLQANPAISPDGTKVAVDRSELKNFNIDIYVYDLRNNTERRITFLPSEDTSAVWMPDGNSLVHRAGGTILQIMRVYLNGAAPVKLAETANTVAEDLVPTSIDAGTGDVLISRQRDQFSVALANVAAPLKEFISENGANICCGVLAPDNKLLAYATDETGTTEIVVTSFPERHGRWQVSRGGGREPRWSRDGKELFFINAKNELSVVQVMRAESESLNFSSPQPLFVARKRDQISSTDLFSYDVSPDGKRFLFNQPIKDEYAPPLHVVFNLPRLLESRQ